MPRVWRVSVQGRFMEETGASGDQGGDNARGVEPSFCSDQPDEQNTRRDIRTLLRSRRARESDKGDEAGSCEWQDELPPVSCKQVSASLAYGGMRSDWCAAAMPR